MFVHSVYFWLGEDLSFTDRERFVAGVRSLLTIEGIEHGYIGTPAPTDRPVIDRSYTWALMLVFADQKAHDAYQAHPVHDRFRNECSRYWNAVRIYDSITVAERSRPRP